MLFTASTEAIRKAERPCAIVPRSFMADSFPPWVASKGSRSRCGEETRVGEFCPVRRVAVSAARALVAASNFILSLCFCTLNTFFRLASAVFRSNSAFWMSFCFSSSIFRCLSSSLFRCLYLFCEIACLSFLVRIAGVVEFGVVIGNCETLAEI